MKKCRITVMRMAQYEDLMAQYENPISHACDMKVGQVFIANGWTRPEGVCQSAWDTRSPFVLEMCRRDSVRRDQQTKDKRYLVFQPGIAYFYRKARCV